MAKVKESKREKVERFRSAIRSSRDLIFTEYQGLKVQELEELKRQLRGLRVTYRVVKNNLFRIALREEGWPEPDPSVFANTLGVCFVPAEADVAQTLKTVLGFMKTTGKMALKPSLVDRRSVGPEDLKAISELPPREVLVARAVGAVKAPLSRLHGALSSPLRKLVLVLKQVADRKAGGQAA